jgi:hypothetical protein
MIKHALVLLAFVLFNSSTVLGNDKSNSVQEIVLDECFELPEIDASQITDTDPLRYSYRYAKREKVLVLIYGEYGDLIFEREVQRRSIETKDLTQRYTGSGMNWQECVDFLTDEMKKFRDSLVPFVCE